MAKARLLLPNGAAVDIEGTAEEVATLLAKFSPDVPSKTRPKGAARKQSSSGSAVGTRKVKAEAPKIDGALNLRGGGGHPAFADFCSEKKPHGHSEFISVAAYYLKKHMQLATATMNHVYTCYKEIPSMRAPEAYRQAFITCKNRTGYIGIDATDNILLTIRGENFVEHDLPKKVKNKKGS